ncbi:S-adenosyl-L-methionine-dependent methyltransferase [Dichotomocladium elegans]|nr:S-adenosyl-L-methionine-dependent methyltransferase [Dichotomocladium elegans]
MGDNCIINDQPIDDDIALFNIESPRSPIPTKSPLKRKLNQDNLPIATQPTPHAADPTGGITEPQVETVVDILKRLLTQVNIDVKHSNDCPKESGPNNNGVQGLMTSFMTTYLIFIEILLSDLLGQNAPSRTLEAYMSIFDPHDRIVGDLLGLQYMQATYQPLVAELRYQLRSNKIIFGSLRWIDTIFTKFYTTYFLEVAAQKHQKDHGQFYTPQSVVQFMWQLCLKDDASVPLVLDPCMGMGAFLCEFFTRLVDKCMSVPSIWNNASRLRHLLCTEIPENIWGVEIDAFALKLGKLNMLVHLFPLYRRLLDLGETNVHVKRFHFFCNDTLKLTVEGDLWEQEQLQRLRGSLKFEYIVTNPPYMIRKTGFITEPDPVLYDTSVLGGRGVQAYVYFMWICLQRCDPLSGQLCLITPSQWLILEFARRLRAWMWKHCQLLQIYQFEPYKVWPKVQTDSLIFRLRMRARNCQGNTLFLRYMSRKADLDEILHAYAGFDPAQPANILYKSTPTQDVNRIHRSPNASFAFLSPTSKLSDQLADLTVDLPRLCYSARSPLLFNRGPNTNPVYALVVRTQWALDYLGKVCYDRWLRPAFYWSGKTSGNDKESTFWMARDPLRLSKKETSPAEAYSPLYQPEAFYSMVLVDKEGAKELEASYAENGDASPYCALYHYLKDTRRELQPTKEDQELAWCQFNKCGVDVPVKIVHPINYGYFTRSQPRQRFFIDRKQLCLTNQCMYFTIKPDCPWQSAEFFCGLLNSSTVQLFIREHCYYDQQGRTRFFGKHMANIPCALPTGPEDVELMTLLVKTASVARECIHGIVWHTGVQGVMEKVRRCSWDLSPADKLLLADMRISDIMQAMTSALSIDQPHWILDELKLRADHLVVDELVRLLKIASLCQYGIDHLAFELYQIPRDLEQLLEKELGLTITEQWNELPLSSVAENLKAVFFS